MKAFLARSIPNLVTEYAVFESALLGEKSCSNSRLFISLKFVVDLGRAQYVATRSGAWRFSRTNRMTTDDFPTAASPDNEGERGQRKWVTKAKSPLDEKATT